MTYRLVNAVYAMVVAPPRANVFLCMQLLDAVAKVLVGVAKGVDVTPDKVVKRYTEVSAVATPHARGRAKAPAHGVQLHSSGAKCCRALRQSVVYFKAGAR